jgi:ubiquinone/menaquinone biosynthesis C-methylase UbiE
VAATSRFERLKGQYGGRLKVQEADVLNLPFDRASFDIVVAFYMMHHIDDVARAVEQFMRVLRPGGLLGIVDHAQRYKDIIDCVGAEANIQASEGGVNFYVWAQKAHPF